MNKVKSFSISVIASIVFVFSVTALANDIIVTTAHDANPSVVDGECSLREAIAAANTDLAVDSCETGAGIDTITFDLTTPAVITLVDEIVISTSLKIQGIGPDELTIDGNTANRHFVASTSQTTIDISDLTLIDGNPSSSSGGSIKMSVDQTLNIDNVRFINNVTTGGGGAIYFQNQPSPNEHLTALNVTRSTFSGNTALGSPSGGAIRMGMGSTLNVSESSFNGNYANSSGGAIYVQSNSNNPSEATIKRSTLYGNTSEKGGGAIALTSKINFTLEHSTIVGNTAGFGNQGDGGGIYSSYSSSTLIIGNSIIAGNTDTTSNHYPDIFAFASSVTSTGYNLIGNNFGYANVFPAGTPNANNDFVGDNSSPIDPLLLPLADNGGPTQTMAVPNPASTLSLVVDNGSCAGELTDQRGFSSANTAQRIFDAPTVSPSVTGGDNCDIGAYEFGAIDISNLTEENEELCVPIKSSSGAIAVVCL